MLQFCRVVERDRVCMYQYEKASRRGDRRTDDTTSGMMRRAEGGTVGWDGMGEWAVDGEGGVGGDGEGSQK